MRLGIIANTFNATDTVARAAELLLDCGAEMIVHCGDVGGRGVLDVLGRYDAAFIWGERDRDRMELLRHAQRLDLPCYGILGSLELDGKRVALCHGDDAALKKRLLDEQQHEYLLIGHPTTRGDQRMGATRVICPGSLQTEGERTVALLDLLSDELQFLSLDVVAPPTPTTERPADEGEARRVSEGGEPERQFPR
jgi:predicted phosphodiesterase